MLLLNTEILENLCISEIPLIHTYIAEKDGYPMKNAGRFHCGMLYTTLGIETYIFGDKSISASPDTVLIIPKGEKYTIELEGEKSVVTAIDFEIEGEANFRPFLVKLGKSNAVKNLFADAEKDWKRKKPGYVSSCKSTFYKIASLLLRQESYYVGSDGYNKIADAIDYLHRHCFEPDFRIDALAEMSEMSQRYFEKLFFAEFKMTPKEYVLSLKLDLAKELLTNEKTTVTDIASKLGYSDIYHFSKLFKAKTGYAPSQYKNKENL